MMLKRFSKNKTAFDRKEKNPKEGGISIQITKQYFRKSSDPVAIASKDNCNDK